MVHVPVMLRVMVTADALATFRVMQGTPPVRYVMPPAMLRHHVPPVMLRVMRDTPHATRVIQPVTTSSTRPLW